MKTPKLAAAALLALVQAAGAQIASQPAICFSFNDFGTAVPTASVSLQCGSSATPADFVVHFIAPLSTTIDQIELWRAGNQASVTGIDLHATPALGAPLTGTPVLASYGGYGFAEGWDACSASPGFAAAVSAGSTYAARIILVPGGPQTWWFCFTPAPCYSFSYDPAGTTPLVYQYNPGICAPSLPLTGQAPVSIRFRGAACGPGPLASVDFVQPDGPCGMSGPDWWSDLLFHTPPVLGTPFPVTAIGPAGDTAHLFWSAGTTAAGVTIAAGSPCVTHLDLASVAALAAIGAEPLVSGTLAPTPAGQGATTWTLLVPGNPAWAGFAIGAQVLIVDPTGTIPIAPGVTARAGATYRITIGY